MGEYTHSFSWETWKTLVQTGG